MIDFILDLDKKLLVFINSKLTAPWADSFFPFITDLHKTEYFKYIVVPLILVIFMWRRGIKKGIAIFLMAILTVSISDGIGNHAFKKTIERPRPADTEGLDVIVRSPYGGYSFVSNHSTNMFCFAGYTATIFPAAAIPLYTLAAVVGYSRIYNGVHFPSDVICGALLGLLVGILFARLLLKAFKRYEEGDLSNESSSHRS